MVPIPDAHARPPDSMRDLFKRRRKQSPASIDSDVEIIDPYNPKATPVTFLPASEQCPHIELAMLEQEFAKGITIARLSAHVCDRFPSPAFEINALPGLLVFPSLLTPRLQIALLEKLLHRDLNNPEHKTNLHLHYNIDYPTTEGGDLPNLDCGLSSFFSSDQSTMLRPKDPSVHRPLTITQMLDSKLRWVTLGGQYDWTNKVYPNEAPPTFPPDIASLLKSLFPSVDAQAAILNFYSPGDTLSIHRDVSEECDRGLISISMGCDGLFLAGNEDGTEAVTLRLRSGDAVLMSGNARYAWHAVPKIIPDTCPSWLQNWPDIDETNKYKAWHGWMRTKRINLNVRQMKES
ncbi:alkylated DNA repair protein AlkB [Exophiala spinifera]|uniref:mRNA N(6)-methyladenine demethylase n=1 Tax=Exophiala spinifera TaxID=91928 RepID=A0A0D2AUF6_9EURO|nr:alkylated DNA repair protein AlkB [Exophiala spinifera]KIW10115.1 alkylated DNA repair protein AlkB [Exophiala spinifera]